MPSMASSEVSAAPVPVFVRSDLLVLVGGGLLCVLSGAAHYGHWNSVVAFVVSAAAVCILASLVGRSVEQLGDRFGPGATGVLQSALGNLPELFICIFALKSGLVDVVRAALVGSILANLLLERYPQLLTARYGFKTEGLDGIAVIEGVAQRRGFRMRGGEFDYEKAAHVLLHDYRTGALGRISLETPETRAAALARHAEEMAEKARIAEEKAALKAEEAMRGKRGT